MTTVSECMIVISHYDRRPLNPLLNLFEAMDRFDFGVSRPRVAVVVNATGNGELPPRSLPAGTEVLYRPNLGMNIGAWDAGYRAFAGCSHCVFLQDECYPTRHGWLASLLEPLNDPSVGLVGESLNASWDRPWAELRSANEGVEMPEHLIDGKPGNRVDVYLNVFKHWKIAPGSTGAHLRSLVWAARREVLDAIGGFPLGANYGECIAAEIAVSRAIIAKGWRLATVSDTPFHSVRHLEWNQDVAGGNFTHKPLMKTQIAKLKVEKERLSARVLELEARLAILEGATVRSDTNPGPGR